MKLIDGKVPAHVLERRKATKAEVAEWFDVSYPTVDAWIRRGCPYITLGSKGVAWAFDLLAVAQWRFGGMDSEAPDGDPDKLPPKDRLDYWRGTREKTKHMEEASQLIPASEHERQLANALKIVATTIESLPDVLERDSGITGDAIEKAQLVCDGMRETIYRKLLDMAEKTHAAV